MFRRFLAQRRYHGLEGLRRSVSVLPTLKDQNADNIVLMGAYRTPFCKQATSYANADAIELITNPISQLARTVAIPKEDIQACIIGNVVQHRQWINIARDALLLTDYSPKAFAYTLTMQCISSLASITMACDHIKSGSCEFVIAGGVDFMSDAPIGISEENRLELLSVDFSYRADERIDTYVRPITSDYKVPEIKEATTGRTMLDECERMCQMFSITRKESDEYAILSHTRALKARNDKKFTDLVPVVLSDGDIVSQDNLLRVPDPKKLAQLHPVSKAVPNVHIRSRGHTSSLFVREHTGTVTPGNSTAVTDGGAASLIASEKKALERGSKPLAYIRDYVVMAHHPKNQLLIGPAYTIPRLLQRNNLTFYDIGVFEIHEAFAGQILCVLKALNSKRFLDDYAKVSSDLGPLTPEMINTWGGSLSLGHPFAATGVRLVAMATNRLKDESKTLALVSACAAGGQSITMLLENYPSSG